MYHWIGNVAGLAYVHARHLELLGNNNYNDRWWRHKHAKLKLNWHSCQVNSVATC